MILETRNEGLSEGKREKRGEGERGGAGLAEGGRRENREKEQTRIINWQKAASKQAGKQAWRRRQSERERNQDGVD